MAFKYKFKTSQSQIKQVHAKYMGHVRDAIISRLEYVGWEFVKMAREGGGYNDVTGNLRSSIGFVVVDRGRIVNENFDNKGKGFVGVKKAKKLTKELASKYSNGYTLIVVAGMEYAAAVENKGKDVITGSSLIAETMLNQAMAKLKKKSIG